MPTEKITTTDAQSVAHLLTTVIKRDGRQAHFDSEKITSAIRRAGFATGEFSEEVARLLTA